MPTIFFKVERLSECACLALRAIAFPSCPACEGIGIAWSERLLAVEYTAFTGEHGCRDRWGAPVEPDTDMSVEIESVVDEEGCAVTLTAREHDRAIEACLRDVPERRNEAMIERFVREEGT